LVFCSDELYREAPTVLTMLASAAPMRVPATPRNDSRTAEETAASALAATCTAERPARGLSVVGLVDAGLVDVGEVFGEVMSSGEGRGGKRLA
jgi:hypothetical protein